MTIELAHNFLRYNKQNLIEAEIFQTDHSKLPSAFIGDLNLFSLEQSSGPKLFVDFYNTSLDRGKPKGNRREEVNRSEREIQRKQWKSDKRATLELYLCVCGFGVLAMCWRKEQFENRNRKLPKKTKEILKSFFGEEKSRRISAGHWENKLQDLRIISAEPMRVRR